MKRFRKIIPLVLLLTMMISSIKAYAIEDNLSGREGNSATMIISGAVTPIRSGYRMYIVDENGSLLSDVVDAVYSFPDCNSYAMTTRIGGYHSNRVVMETAGIPRPILDNTKGNGERVNSWMTTKHDDHYNVDDVIGTYFGEAIHDEFRDTSTIKYLCVEPIVWCNAFSSGTTSRGWFYGTSYNWLQYYGGGLAGSFIRSVINKRLPEAVFAPYSWLGLDSNLDIGGYITAGNIGNKAYCIGLYRNLMDMQTTADEPQMPSPHAAAEESVGHCNIVKTYRIVEPNGDVEDMGTFTRQNISTDILIEGETGWALKGYSISSSLTSPIEAETWEESVPQEKGRHEGGAGGSVKLTKGDTLYLLLEKYEDEPEDIPDEIDYTISQSRITKRISMSAPESDNEGLKNIVNTEFTWKIGAHSECKGHHCCNCHCPSHWHYDPKANPGHRDEDGDLDEGGDVQDPCPDPSGKCECNTKHYTHEYEAETSWNNDKQLVLSLNNTTQADYCDILVPQNTFEWNVEAREKGGSSKGFYNDKASIDRKSATADESYGPEKNWDYTCVIMRGKDKLTLSEWINQGGGNVGETGALEDLVNVSESGFMAGNVPKGIRKVADYMEYFSVNLDIDTGYDIRTTWKPSKSNTFTGCKCGACKFADTECTTMRYAEVNGWSSGQISVLVEVYSGDPEGGYNDTTYNDNEMIIPSTIKSGYNRTSGRMIAGKTITFYPYIEMQYDKVTATNLKAYVMSQYSRSITVNDFSEINWNKKDSENLTIYSNQWSTHAQAKKDYGTKKVIPGGAQLGVKIEDGDRQVVNVTTYQVILEGTGLTQVEKTGSYDAVTQTRANAIGEHNAFVASVVEGLDTTSIIEYASDKKDGIGNVWEFGGQVYPGSSLSCIGSSLRASIEDKYYFRDEDGVYTVEAQQGDFDVENLGTDTHTYTFYTTTSGGLNCSKDNTSPKNGEDNATGDERELINERTGVEDKLRIGVEQFSGNDGDAQTGTTWYNEAFDGVTIIVQSTNLRVGYKYPSERINIIDPKLTPESNGQKELFSDYNVSQYRTKNYSASYNEPYIMGIFKSKKVKMIDLDNFFWSRKFWIPNVTTQDLH